MTDRDALPTGLQLTVMDPVFRDRPLEHLDVLRAADPVHHDTMLSRYVLTRAADIGKLLSNRRHSVGRNHAAPGSFADIIFSNTDIGDEPSMLLRDDPDHKRLRSLVTQAFNARAIEAMRSHIVEIADALLDAVADAPEFDLIEAFASPLPIIVIAEMLGVDPADRADFRRWSQGTSQAFSPVKTPEVVAALHANNACLNDYFSRVVAERRAAPRTDLISAMVAAENDGDRLSDREIVTMCNLLLVAGNVTTTDLIGNCVYALLRHPAELAKLRARSELMPAAVEETLRYDPPVTQSLRTVVTDTEIGGVTIPAGASVLPMLMAGAHDPALHTDPQRFDIERADKTHFAFGGGAHFCLGAPLSKAEAEIALARLLARYPALQLADHPVERNSAPSFNGLNALWVRG